MALAISSREDPVQMRLVKEVTRTKSCTSPKMVFHRTTMMLRRFPRPYDRREVVEPGCQGPKISGLAEIGIGKSIQPYVTADQGHGNTNTTLQLCHSFNPSRPVRLDFPETRLNRLR